MLNKNNFIFASFLGKRSLHLFLDIPFTKGALQIYWLN